MNPRPDKHYIPPSYRLSRSLFSPFPPERHGAERIARLLYAYSLARANLAASDLQPYILCVLQVQTTQNVS